MRICDRCRSSEKVNLFIMPDGMQYGKGTASGIEMAFSQSHYDLCKSCADDFLRTVKRFHTTEIIMDMP